MDKDVAGKVKSFFSHYPLKRFKKGQTIVYAGEDPPGIFYLQSGAVRQYDITRRGDEVVVNVFKPPAFFPMSWAVNRQRNLYFFETITSTEVRLIPPKEAVRFLQRNPDVMFDLLSRLYSGVDGLQRRMAHLMGGSARSRILFELTVECKRFGKHLGNGAYRLSLKESELAQHVGLSRETTNRELSKLKARGLVSYSGGLVVNSLPDIEEALGDTL